MKTYINAPKNAKKLSKLPVGTLQDESPFQDFLDLLKDGACQALTSIGVGMGCKASEKSSFVETLCNAINSALTGIGCEPIEPEPEPECINDDDCDEGEECVANECVEVHECEEDADCEAWQSCNGAFECEDNPDDCRNPATECDEWEECNEENGHCDPYAGRCNSDDDCESETPACKLENHSCVECTENADCTVGSENICKQETNTCVECQQWEDCGTGHECVSESCVDCNGVGSICTTSENCCSYLMCDIAITGKCQIPP